MKEKKETSRSYGTIDICKLLINGRVDINKLHDRGKAVLRQRIYHTFSLCLNIFCHERDQAVKYSMKQMPFASRGATQ